MSLAAPVALAYPRESHAASGPAAAGASLTSPTPQPPFVKVPEALRDADRHGAIVRTLEYDDSSVIAVDFGTDASDVSIDVVGSTAIIVVNGAERNSADRPDGEQPPEDKAQFEFELPPEATDVSVRNGVLTIEE